MVDADVRTGPVRAATGRPPQGEVPQRRLARAVTWTLVGTLLAVGATEYELWPLTAYRLFSNVRTGTASSLELVAVSADGTRIPLRLDSSNPVVATTVWQYGRIPDADPAEQRRLVRAWLHVAGIDPSGVAEVRLERARTTTDPQTLTRSETSREVLAEVVP
ncbi:hypothetical protein [Cellulomonas wangsupingiae]|uniref:hypothetical protein n=1 Tax=Cellulomonas wangsupingiae TaxID=2968085 RepID=UPI001D0DDB55|nr:hypothetical protein [Cellulomonas wangsupingiae]MCM0640742.1 hypothetical protein [Cellulomonas wangsupingiae]